MIKVTRTYFKDHTEYRVKDFAPVIVAMGERDMLDEEIADGMEAKVLRLFKRKIADKMSQEIKFEISTVEPEKPKEEQKLLPVDKRESLYESDESLQNTVESETEE